MKMRRVATPEQIRSAVQHFEQGNSLMIDLIDNGLAQADSPELEELYKDLKAGYSEAVELLYDVADALLTTYKGNQ